MGVSEASLKRWCDRGLIPSVRTAGGRAWTWARSCSSCGRAGGRCRRRSSWAPSTVARRPRVLATAGGEAVSALATGDAERCRGLVFSLYVAGHSVAEIGDEVIAPAFAALDSQWRDGILAVYEERRACEIVIRILHELRRALPRVATDAPLAAGGTLSGDPYTVANTMVEVVLREAGWRTVNLGCGLPVAAIAAAVIDLRPQLLWLSLSEPGPAEGLPRRRRAGRRAARHRHPRRRRGPGCRRRRAGGPARGRRHHRIAGSYDPGPGRRAAVGPARCTRLQRPLTGVRKPPGRRRRDRRTWARTGTKLRIPSSGTPRADTVRHHPVGSNFRSYRPRQVATCRSPCASAARPPTRPRPAPPEAAPPPTAPAAPARAAPPR